MSTENPLAIDTIRKLIYDSKKPAKKILSTDEQKYVDVCYNQLLELTKRSFIKQSLVTIEYTIGTLTKFADKDIVFKDPTYTSRHPDDIEENEYGHPVNDIFLLSDDGDGLPIKKLMMVAIDRIIAHLYLAGYKVEKVYMNGTMVVDYILP